MRALGLTAGLAVGLGIKPVLYNLLPAENKEMKKFIGVVPFLVGSMVTLNMRQRIAKDVGLVLAGIGIYDLIASNLPMLNLPSLPVWTMGSGDGVGVPEIEGESETTGLSYETPETVLGLNYAPEEVTGMGSSYNPESYSNDNPFQDIYGY